MAAMLMAGAAAFAGEFTVVQTTLAWSKPVRVTNDFGTVRILQTAPATPVFWSCARRTRRRCAPLVSRHGPPRTAGKRFTGRRRSERAHCLRLLAFAGRRGRRAGRNTKTAHEAGIKFPVFITRGVFELCDPIPPGISGRQDEAGRLWDVVWMLRFAILRARAGVDRISVSRSTSAIPTPSVRAS